MRFEPPRGAFYPDKVLDIITNVEIKDLLLEAKEKDNEILKLEWELYSLQVKDKEKDDEIYKLQLETIILQHQARDRLAILQEHANAILAQNFELHEYSIPRLFIVLPVDTTKWDPMNILRNKFRLHFLCEGENHTVKAGKSSQSQIHVVQRDGYEIQNSTEFFHKYGKYILILLQWLKSEKSSTPLVDAINHSIEYMMALTVEYPTLKNINSIDDYEGLEVADLRQLNTFLQINDKEQQHGNLHRVMTEAGHVKWVCLDHYHAMYNEKEQRALENTVKMDGGKCDSYLGKVVITLKSRNRAKEFFAALGKTRGVYELDITFNWDWTKADLETFEDILKKSSVSILRLELGRFQEGINWPLSKTSTRYEILARIIELSSMKAIHLVLSPELIKLSNLHPKISPRLHKLTIEMKPRKIGPNDFKELAHSLKTNTVLTILNLEGNSIGKEGARVLSEALKTNSTLTTLDLESNSIMNEGALVLAEALKVNTTLTTMKLTDNSIGDGGALALSEALKVNATLTTMGLKKNSIGDKGALALAGALKTNRTLTILDLYNNSIEDKGALALSQALKANISLTTLYLKGNPIGDEGAFMLLEVLKTNIILTSLDLFEE
ncbi:hypothetical protein BX616_006227 [Lobosporangium transversale]|nr:hypothetical protein BX616_006227 [Lobosporangium transversale]